ncbi:hypothetical protein ACSFC1_04135 [Pseudothermotoga sp. U03pept]|uniref:hypothetical protein n=1 Tax=Pseudothermotoga sp. U03pept TaxID=3447012 RepID=UPI003F05F838
MLYLVLQIKLHSRSGELLSPTPQSQAEDLATRIKTLVTSSSERTYGDLRKIIYVRSSDVNDSDVEELVEDSVFALLPFVPAGTPTQITVAGVTEPKQWIITDKPSFVDKIYSVTYVCTTADSTKTVVDLPMITITGTTTSYLLTVYIEGTDDATNVDTYPHISFGP